MDWKYQKLSERFTFLVFQAQFSSELPNLNFFLEGLARQFFVSEIWFKRKCSGFVASEERCTGIAKNCN